MKIYTDNVFCLARKKSFCTFRETLLKHWNLLTHPVDGGEISAKWKYFISPMKLKNANENFWWKFLWKSRWLASDDDEWRQKRIPNSNQVIQFFAIQISPALFAFRNRNWITSLAHMRDSFGAALPIQGGITFRTLIEKWSAKASITMINYIKDRVVPATSASSLFTIIPDEQFEY